MLLFKIRRQRPLSLSYCSDWQNMSKMMKVGIEGRGGGQESQFLEYVARVAYSLHNMVLVIIFFSFSMWKTIYNFTLSQSSRSNGLTFSICEARFVLLFFFLCFCQVSASHRCFSSRKVSTFSSPPHSYSLPVTRLMSMDYIDKIWKEIKGKNHHHSPARPLPASILPASRLAPVITGMFLLQ